jgi:hypothetical protein
MPLKSRIYYHLLLGAHTPIGILGDEINAFVYGTGTELLGFRP